MVEDEHCVSTSIYHNVTKHQPEEHAREVGTCVLRQTASRTIRSAWHTKMRCPNRALTDLMMHYRVSLMRIQSFWNYSLVQVE